MYVFILITTLLYLGNLTMQLDMTKMAENAEHAEQFLKLLSNKNRLMILCTLNDGEKSVSELNQLVPLTQSALSQHLAGLRQSGLVETRREAQTIYYSLTDDRVRVLLQTLYQVFCQAE